MPPGQSALCNPGGMPESTPLLWPLESNAGMPLSLRAVLGPLAEFVDDPRVSDVFVLGSGQVFVDSGDGAYPVMGLVLSRTTATELARSLIEHGGRHIDDITPVADVSLGTGIRVHAVLPPISTAGPLVSIRVGQKRPARVEDLELEHRDLVIPALLRAVAAKKTLLISGATGSGKTTMLAALLSYAPRTERLLVVEDVAELRIDHPHVVSLETRQANIEGTGEIGLTRLLREALRMRPDRLIVGECRGVEIADMLQAFLTGHTGGATTVHAATLQDVPARLHALGGLAGLTERALSDFARGAFDLVVHLERAPDGVRRAHCGRLVLDEKGELGVETVDLGSI